jgi:hypothetical protein
MLGGVLRSHAMPAIVTEILRFPLFPIAILALIGGLYWRGFMTMRQKKQAAEAARRPDDR